MSTKLAAVELVKFDVTLPALDGELPTYELSPSRPRQEFLDLLRISDKQRQSLLSDREGLDVAPSFAALERNSLLPEQSAADLLNKTASKMAQAFVPGQDTLELADGRVLYSARAHRGESDEKDTYEPDRPRLLYVSLRRSVEGHLVDGPGSRFTSIADPNGELLGAVFHWKAKQPSGKPFKRLSSVDAQAAIRLQLDKVSQELPAGLQVKKVDVAYYDADKKFLQPVYRYVAEVKRTPKSIGKSDFYVGYIPINEDTASEVPSQLSKLDGPADFTLPPETRPQPGPRTDKDIAIGRYVAVDKGAGWARASEDFWSELTAGSLVDPKSKLHQHYRAARFMFTSRKAWFADRVDLALVEAHGVPLAFMTFGDFSGDVGLQTDVPLSGYGEGGDGYLKHLVLHSCRVVPASVDYFNNPRRPWARAWWSLFNGLMSVVGYRSSMYVDDGAGAAFGRHLVRNEPVVPAWFNAVASLNIYDDGFFKDTECEPSEPMGRASAVTVCDSGPKATLRDGSKKQPECLESWYFGDDLIPAKPGTPARSATHQEICPDKGGGGPYVTSPSN